MQPGSGEGQILSTDRRWPSGAAIVDRAERTPLITHVIFRLDVGGLENGLVNPVNNLSAERYRHTIDAVYATMCERLAHRVSGQRGNNKKEENG